MPRRRPPPAPASQRERIGIAASECPRVNIPAAEPDIVRLLAGWRDRAALPPGYGGGIDIRIISGLLGDSSETAASSRT